MFLSSACVLTTLFQLPCGTEPEGRACAILGLPASLEGKRGSWRGLARTSSDEHGHVELLHEAHGLRVALQAQVEASQPVCCQRIRACSTHPADASWLLCKWSHYDLTHPDHWQGHLHGLCRQLLAKHLSPIPEGSCLSGPFASPTKT